MRGTSNSSYLIHPTQATTHKLDTHMHQAISHNKLVDNASYVTALSNNKDIKEHKMWMKTIGNRKQETEQFVKSKLLELHLEQMMQ